MASKTSIRADLKKLQPENTKIPTALNFLRLVVTNNKSKNSVALNKRSDVQGAEQTILDWYTSVSEVAKDIAELIPKDVGKVVVTAVANTMDKIIDEVAITDSNISTWRTSPENRDVWAAKLLIRMKFLLKWLESQANNMVGAKGSYKVWQSRLAPNTCKWCKALHNVKIPINESFEAAAKSVGWERSYGGLYVPGLHPGCRCWVVYK